MGTMRTSWEQKDFDELFDGNKRNLIVTVWELDENKKDFDGNKENFDENYLGTWWEQWELDGNSTTNPFKKLRIYLLVIVL